MSPFIAEEGTFWISSVLLGISVAFAYDCLRVFRRVVAHGAVLISLEDLLYWVFVSFRFFSMLYEKNDGAVRWFAIAGAFLGMVLFEKTLGPPFVRYVSALLLKLREVLGKALRFLLAPLSKAKSAAGKALGRGVRSGRRCLRRGMRLAKKRLTVWGRMAKIIICGRKKKGQRGD